MGKLAGDYSIDMSKAKNEVFDWMDWMYEKVGDGRDHCHVEVRTIYAFLSGRYPMAYMEDCFILVQDICDMCNGNDSVYPYPDGEWWTDEEIEKYVKWKDGVTQ